MHQLHQVSSFYQPSPSGLSQVGWTVVILTVVVVLARPTAVTGDDRKPFYDPIERELAGWKITVDPALLTEANQEVCRQSFEALENHLQRIRFIVPQDRLVQLQKLPIWLDLHHPVLANMQYHPSRDWLVDHGHDPRLAKHVHIPRARQLYERHMWAKHPYVVLHELAHAFHDQILGFDHPEILQAYQEAKQEGQYESVLLFTGETTRHYGITDHKEYFAEATEAYFGVNDFYPFVRAELRQHDPRLFALMEDIWGKIR